MTDCVKHLGTWPFIGRISDRVLIEMAFSCTPISQSDFPLDPSLGDLLHRITKQQCEAVAELVQHVNRRDLDEAMWWSLGMGVLGVCMLFVTLRLIR